MSVGTTNFEVEPLVPYAAVRWELKAGRVTRWHLFPTDDAVDGLYVSVCGLGITEQKLNATKKAHYQQIWAFGTFLDEPQACRMCVHECKKLLLPRSPVGADYLTRQSFGFVSANGMYL